MAAGASPRRRGARRQCAAHGYAGERRAARRRSSTSCTSISTIIRSRFSRASRRRSSPRCTAASIFPSIDPCSNLSASAVVSISRVAAEAPADRAVGKTMLHGLPETLLAPTDRKPDYLAFLGRISPEKGVAVPSACRGRAASRSRSRPRSTGPTSTTSTRRSAAAQRAGHRVHRRDQRRREVGVLGGAVALLAPIDWPEPFGLVMIEAMACGTPVDRLPARRGARDRRGWGHRLASSTTRRRQRPRSADCTRCRRVRHPPPLRGALHRAPHGRGLSRHLRSIARREGEAASHRSGTRRTSPGTSSERMFACQALTRTASSRRFT